MSGWTRRINNRMPVVVAALLMASVGHNAVAQMATETPATTLTETDQPVACADFAPDTGIRFDLAGFCAKWSGSLQGIYQNDLSTTGSAPAWFMGVVHSSNQQNVYTFNATTSLAAKRQTPLGLLDSNLTLQWQKPSNDGTYAGAATVLELRASLAGATVGYTRSLMDFWWEDFLFLAASTDRAAGIVSYEHRVIDGLNLAVAIESGLPASQQDTEGLRSISFNSPLLTAHLLYTTPDNQSFQLAGVLRQANDQTNPVLASRASTTSTRTGCALSAGATVPTTFTGAEDYVSGQVVYAVDASYFLGTKVDLSALSSILPYTPPTARLERGGVVPSSMVGTVGVERIRELSLARRRIDGRNIDGADRTL